MTWSEQVFRYCERAQDPAFWAEPLNAVSNVGFLLVAALAARRLAAGDGGWVTATPPQARDPLLYGLLCALVALAAAIGIGSFLFHTLATRWARLADVVPIGFFMVAYLAFALRAFLGLGWTAVAGAMLAFLAANQLVAMLACPRRLADIASYARDPCMNGTMSYLPALATLALVGTLLARRHAAGRALLIAAGIFLAAMLLRWIDMRTCAWTPLLGRPRGTHALWHLLNALTLHVLLQAALAAPGRTGAALSPPVTLQREAVRGGRRLPL